MTANRKLPAVLTIAGSDSGGGAGVQADLRTFNAFKVYGCSAITAVTSQNPDEVRRVDVLPGDAVKCQLESILAAFPVRFAKSGMLVNGEIIECGTPEELLALKGKYYKLVQIQSMSDQIKKTKEEERFD